MISRLLPIGLLISGLAGTNVFAQNISTGGSFTVLGRATGGGAASAGGAFQVVGEIGRAAPGIVSGGNFTLQTPPIGYYSIPVGDFELDIILSGSFVRLTWPAEASSYTLQSSSLLGPNASWNPVPGAAGQSSITVQAGATAQFFRLRSP